MGKLEALVKKAKKGDGEAFVSLVQRYEDVLYKVASRLLQKDEDVADAMQEAITVAYEKIHTLKNEEYFNTWICKILINTCNSILNKRQNITLADEHVEQKQNKNEFLKIELEDALNYLNKNHKEAIVLYYIAGFSIKEMSVFLKEPEGTIKSRLSRAKAIYENDEHKTIEGRWSLPISDQVKEETTSTIEYKQIEATSNMKIVSAKVNPTSFNLTFSVNEVVKDENTFIDMKMIDEAGKEYKSKGYSMNDENGKTTVHVNFPITSYDKVNTLKLTVRKFGEVELVKK